MRRWTLLAAALVLAGCSHTLEVKNLDLYQAPARVEISEFKPNVAVLPFAGTTDEMFFFNAIVERLSQSRTIASLRTDYVALGQAPPPDLIVKIAPHATYRSSGWNFWINWPGFLIFTPAWNGYVYHADLVTDVTVYDNNGDKLVETSVPISYNIRQAEMDRTIFTGLTWLEVSLLAFGGGIYNWRNFDRDIIGALQVYVKDNYATYVMNTVGPKVVSAAEATAAARAAEAAAAAAATEPAGSSTAPNAAPTPLPAVAAPPPPPQEPATTPAQRGAP